MDIRLKKNINHPLHKDLGVESISSNDGVGIISIKLNEYVMNPDGLFHGGVIYLLCDVCAYSGLVSILDSNLTAVTHDIQVSIMKSAKVGDRAEFKSRVVRLGRRLCFLEVVVTVGDVVIATAKITKSIISI
jgi:uncharacterized protein (TIGR00369 family)